MKSVCNIKFLDKDVISKFFIKFLYKNDNLISSLVMIFEHKFNFYNHEMVQYITN